MRKSSAAVNEMVRDCLAVRVRLIGRAITAIYEHALAGHGLTIAQLNMLAALGKLGPSSLGKIGQVLQLERSTVSRNLDLLLKADWVTATSSDAKGIREVELTAAGLKKIDSVLPDWRKAQAEAAQYLGENGERAVHRVADGGWRNIQ